MDLDLDLDPISPVQWGRVVDRGQEGERVGLGQRDAVESDPVAVVVVTLRARVVEVWEARGRQPPATSPETTQATSLTATPVNSAETLTLAAFLVVANVGASGM